MPASTFDRALRRPDPKDLGQHLRRQAASLPTVRDPNGHSAESLPEAQIPSRLSALKLARLLHERRFLGIQGAFDPTREVGAESVPGPHTSISKSNGLCWQYVDTGVRIPPAAARRAAECE
jgi:hypothetical protein